MPELRGRLLLQSNITFCRWTGIVAGKVELWHGDSIVAAHRGPDQFSLRGIVEPHIIRLSYGQHCTLAQVNLLRHSITVH